MSVTRLPLCRDCGAGFIAEALQPENLLKRGMEVVWKQPDELSANPVCGDCGRPLLESEQADNALDKAKLTVLERNYEILALRAELHRVRAQRDNETAKSHLWARAYLSESNRHRRAKVTAEGALEVAHRLMVAREVALEYLRGSARQGQNAEIV